MRGIEIHVGTQGHNAMRVDGGMGAIVVLLNVHHVDSILHPRPLIHVPNPSPQVGVVHYPLLVALEVA